MAPFVPRLRRHARNFFTNWSNSDLPYGRRVAVTLRNRALAHVRGCCGNHGEPGC